MLRTILARSPVRPAAIAATALLLASCQTAAPAQNIASAGVVEAADPRAAEACREMLRRGGSATDAALAVMIALTVVEPQSSGIGGGGFMLRAQADGTITTFDGRETAPSAATPEWFLNEEGEPQSSRDIVRTGLSIGVPGNIALAAQAHAAHGRLEWSELFEPAIALAEGFRMNPRLHQSLTGNIERAGLDPAMRATFYEPNGEPFAVGTLIHRPQLAESFRQLAEDGPEAMYGEEAAAQIAAHISANTPANPSGGMMTAADITSYQAIERDALCGTYRGYRICGMGPPTSGGIAVLQILGQLERFELSAHGSESVAFWHLFAQSQLLAFADRGLYTGDSDFVSVPAQELVSPAYIAARSQLIDPQIVPTTYPAGEVTSLSDARALGQGPVENGTTHFVAVDAWGAMVSYTSTVEGGFGSGLTYGGYHLNNELTDFSFRPDQDGVPVANRVEGGKRPRSSMSPTIIWDPDGEPFLVIGGAGGPFIPVQTARSIIGVIDFDMSLEDAFSQPIVMGFGPNLFVESDTWLATQADALTELGYANVRVAPQPFGSVGQVGARNRGGQWRTAYDPRFRGRLEATPIMLD